MKKNILIALLIFFIGSCSIKKKKVSLIDSSWYLYKSTDTTNEVLSYDTLYRTKISPVGNICVYHFSIDYMIEDKLLLTYASDGLVDLKGSNKKWKLKKDTLNWGEEQFLIKTLTLDSLILQKIKDKKVTSIINTYYRIGI